MQQTYAGEKPVALAMRLNRIERLPFTDYYLELLRTFLGRG
jgi:hypothetical protein